MIQDKQLVRVIELIKNGISKEDFEFFLKNANQYSAEAKGPYGKSLHKDEWENYFKSHRNNNSFNKLKIELIFNYLKDFYPNSHTVIPKDIFAFNKIFPYNFDFSIELLIYKIIEIYKS